MSEQRSELRAILSVGLSSQSNLDESYRRVQQPVETRGGWLFRRELEGLWCSFPSLREAVLAARDICQAEGAGLFGFRFGLHYGDVVISTEGDVLGNVLSIAKRLETAGAPGVLLVSSEAAGRLEEFQPEPPMLLSLKGVGEVEARRLVLAEFSLVDSLQREDWQALERGELLVCLVGPLGGPAELEGLWGEPFYEAAQDREAEVGRAQLLEEFRAWQGSLAPQGGWSAPTLCFFPENRLEHALKLADEVLTEEDLDEFWSGLPAQLHGWETALTTYRIFWVGPGDWLEDFYREVRRRFPAGPQQREFILQMSSDPQSAAGRLRTQAWKRRGLPVFQGSQPLVDLLGRVGQQAQAPPSLQAERPYRFLDSYGPNERAIFFGREREAHLLYSWILTRRWLVLYGRSGVGKSSLLGAGVWPLLHESDCQVRTVRCLDDPVQQLQGLRAEAEAASRRLVLFFDQFEEYFVRLSPAQRQELGRLLGDLCEVRRLHLLFSLREDFLAEMAALEEWIPTLLDSRFRLTALTREQARQCICGPAQLFGVQLDPKLVETLLDELESQGVEPPELQIVMDRLWDHGLTLDNYRRLGGVRSLLLDYLHEAMQGWQDDKPRQILSALVSERGTKQALTMETLRSKVAEPEQALQSLVQARLVRTVQNYFELCHEYLIEEIQTWADHEELARRHAEMVLHSELESWESLHSLMTPPRLSIVAQELSRLQPTEAEWELLLRASMVHGIELSNLGPLPEKLLINLLEEDLDGLVQRRVLEQLASLPLEQGARERFLRGASLYSNPSLLQRLQPLLDGEFYAAVAGATRQRFFGEAAMAYVPAGPALLGSDESNKAERKSQLPRYWHARIDSERALEQVEVAGFWVDRRPVTNLQFTEFRPPHIDRYPDEEHHHPVVSVSWHDAQAYAQWLGKELICETRWEKAARGSDGRLYPWGSDYRAECLNSQEGGLRTTSDVSDHLAGASPYGCLDMAGNVWEWTASSWSEGGPFKVQKGGSTLNPAPLQQCSARQEAFPDFVLQWVGFRLMSLEGP